MKKNFKQSQTGHKDRQVRWCPAHGLRSRNLTHPQEGINNYKFISKAKQFNTHTEERDVLIQYIYTHTWSIMSETHGEQC